MSTAEEIAIYVFWSIFGFCSGDILEFDGIVFKNADDIELDSFKFLVF